MPRSRDFLERFRPSGTPGAAAAVGVPADHIAERTAELEAVFQRLADTEEEVRRIRAEAEQEAARRRTAAAERARAYIARARREAEAEHAEAAAKVRRQVEVETAEALAAATREADTIRARTAERLPDYVGLVLAAVRADIGTLLGEDRR